ncbi:MAG: hypothetical protein EZS28_035612 [Streblomastix strix]|uniref:Uncharacterized protein n=1 Tax=Streblomastix strix TaxID=222440 RepID=A0A5J4UG71_9EUKA|nr:MAG: hypothetical protein EZS28_035612 [Streblomastix strix]
MKNNNFQRKEINLFAAVIIGSTYKASKMPDEFRRIVIEQLKLAAQHKDKYIAGLSALILVGLSECVDNHTDIIAEIIPNILRKYISEGEHQLVNQGMMLALNLLYYGSDETKEKVIEAIPKESIAQFLRQINDQNGLIFAARLLNEWIQFIS